MSIFGDDSPPSNSTRALFSPPFSDMAAHDSPSLFADDDSSATPWSSSRSARDLVKTLLTRSNANIPRAYDRIYDALVSEFGGDGTDITAGTASQRVLDDAGVGGRAREKVLSAVVKDKSRLEREEVWVLIAMAGAAQVEGEDVSVDSVDDRRHDLPVPRLVGRLAEAVTEPEAGSEGELTEGEERTTIDTIRHAHSHSRSGQEGPTIVTREQHTPISTSPVRTRSTAALFANHEDNDPWAAPAKPPAPVPPQQSQSEQQAHQDDSLKRHSPGGDHEDHDDTDIHAALRNAGMSGEGSNWGGVYDSPEQGFGGEQFENPGGFGESPHPGLGPRLGSFGGLGGQVINGGVAGSVGNNIASGLERIKAAMKAPEEVVTVTVLPEKEGMFLFQHRNYQIVSPKRNSRVVRRYSDFVWLLDCLHKRYPFRQLPLLPPKRLAVNGHYLSADATFLERRRRGLVRFLNTLVRHPILCQEQLVIMFLTVPTELSVWRKQATISIVDEFSTFNYLGPSDPPLPPETFTTIRSGLRKSADQYIALCTVLDRVGKRLQGVAADYQRFATGLRSLTDASEALYAIDTSDVPRLNNGLLAVAGALNQSRTLLGDEADTYDATALESLKSIRDELVSMRELFDRVDKALSADPVPGLTRRIQRNEGRGRTEEEQARWQKDVENDKRAIKEWGKRKGAIGQCVVEELAVFHRGMNSVGKMQSEWAVERVKFVELQGDVWRGLLREVEGMPGGEQ